MPRPLVAQRLTLLPYSLVTDAQLDCLVSAWDLPEVWRYVGAGRRLSFTRLELDAALARGRADGSLGDELLVMRTNHEAVLGTCGLYPSSLDGGSPDETDLGYRYGRAFPGSGYGFEAAQAVVQWGARERGLPWIGSNVQIPNVASQKILR